MAEQKNASNLPALPADLPENWTYGQIVSPNGTEAGLTPKHGYNYLMRQVNQAQALLNQVTAMIQSEMATQDYVDAAINGRVPTTRKVNGKALSGDISLTAADVGALGSGSTAEAAKKLLTPRSIRANLASSAAANFDGTANITPGVAGILPVANGGTGSSVEKYLPLAGGTIAGNLTLKNSTAFGCKLNFGDGDYVHISEPTDDNMEIKAKNVTFSTTNPIHGVPTPSAGTDAANKDYVDNKNAKAGSFYLSTLEISLVESLVEAGKIFKLKRKPVISGRPKDGTYQITSLYYSEGDEPLIVYAWPMHFSISGGDATTELSVYIYNPSSSNIRMSRMSAAIRGCIVAYEGW